MLYHEGDDQDSVPRRDDVRANAGDTSAPGIDFGSIPCHKGSIVDVNPILSDRGSCELRCVISKSKGPDCVPSCGRKEEKAHGMRASIPVETWDAVSSDSSILAGRL